MPLKARPKRGDYYDIVPFGAFPTGGLGWSTVTNYMLANARNGLSKVDEYVELGGTLLHNTNIVMDQEELVFQINDYSSVVINADLDNDDDFFSTQMSNVDDSVHTIIQQHNNELLTGIVDGDEESMMQISQGGHYGWCKVSAVNVATFSMDTDGEYEFWTTNGIYAFRNIQEHADNSAATTAGLTTGMIYRTGDLLKIVH